MLDLSQLNKYKENNRLEAKKAQGGLPHSIWETYSAFANTFGGYILLGVVENADKSFSSVPLPSPEKLVVDFWNSVNNHSVVNVNILSDQNVQIVESGGNQIVVIEVPRADRHDKPVYMGVDPFAGTYRRNGEGDYRCTRDEVRAMMRDQADISQDARVMDTMTIDCLDRDTIRRYRQRMDNLRPSHVWSELAVEDFLHRIGAMARDTNGKLCPTAAGLLMSVTNTKLYASSHIIFWITKSMTALPQKMNGGQIVSFPVPAIGAATFAIFTSAYTTE